MSESGALRYRCPCCGAHTLDAIRSSDRCALCKWGHADDDSGYTLDEARENVKLYGVMFGPSDERFAPARHPIFGPAGETAIDRVALRGRTYVEFANFAKGRSGPVVLSERLISLLTIVRHADTLYVKN